MAVNPITPSATETIVDKNGRMEQTFRDFTQDVVASIQLLQPIIGSGSPEGSVSAPAGRMYIDQTGAPGSVLFVKQSDSVGGDRTLGWAAV